MEEPGKTQKQISDTYQGNLDRYRKIQWNRLSRFLASFFAMALAVAAIIAWEKRGDERFFNPGALSSSHAALVNRCASCHDKSLLTENGMQQAKWRLAASDRFRHGIAFDPIDQKCETCHFQQDKRVYAFHEPNVVKNRSCSVCHQEHVGAGPMQKVASAQCATCHDSRLTMAAAAEKGRHLSLTNFHRHPHPPQQTVFELPRPPDGYTATFAAFWEGHPQFQLKREAVRDPDALKFNHERHFAADVPPINGKKLECTFCHQPDSEGRYNNQRITFKGQCQICHSLQFDPKNPELTLPHGSTSAIRGFLHALPEQYAELAVKKRITRPNEIANFVTRQMLQLRARVRSGEDFERQIFFATDPYKLSPGTDVRVRALFYGCALCHEVQPRENTAPFIAKPIFFDRWMPQARFDHTKHTMVKCDDCHHATRSRLTSDVLMPGIESCVSCHSPQGKVVAECITCHSYHVPPSFAFAGAPNEKRFAQKARGNLTNATPSLASVSDSAKAEAWSSATVHDPPR